MKLSFYLLLFHVFTTIIFYFHLLQLLWRCRKCRTIFLYFITFNCFRINRKTCWSIYSLYLHLLNLFASRWLWKNSLCWTYYTALFRYNTKRSRSYPFTIVYLSRLLFGAQNIGAAHLLLYRLNNKSKDLILSWS